ncbi:hypothetical protein [Pseudobutyrivibrio sp. MD2005]|uniref:hypothetical protein n=1 Tax=Pseudobutyrivibrio sp. MD2005 TaxID=1410616 RepID=UPI0004802F28|nr:hypothetical protein [Pseudobutyrivibrio sp. MD2005]
MEFVTNQYHLNSIYTAVNNSVNAVHICEDKYKAGGIKCTLWEIKDHTLAKQLVSELEGNKACEMFSMGSRWFFIFPYREFRPLNEFYRGSSPTLNEGEGICIRLVMECMTINLPFSILYLILSQNRINLSKDNSIYFDYCVDMTEYSEKIKERDCANECVGLLLDMLEPFADQKANSQLILSAKRWRNGYNTFIELYKDVHMAEAPAKKYKLRVRLKRWFKRHQELLFRILLVFCLILLVLVIIMVISQIFTGGVPFLRIFFNPFKEIGTETMLQ